MGIPTLKQAFCSYPLRSGVSFIWGISLLWNIGWYFFDESKSPPFVLEILDSQNFIQLPDGHHFVEYRRCYYIIQIVVLIIALVGECTGHVNYTSEETEQSQSGSSSTKNQCYCVCEAKSAPGCLFPWMVIEQLMIYIYAFATVRYGYMYYMRYSEGKSIFTTDMLHEILFPILFALHFYLCWIIYSYYIELKRKAGRRVTLAPSPTVPESAPSRNDHTSPDSSPST
ncbi:uncharacterized protein LOC135834509 [Planococcus citri]|uniref:uncharacterized protein LOC135834509 n=1 Tax=Planococcus citri TaxID=170843 RepID=UPI0031F9ED72